MSEQVQGSIDRDPFGMYLHEISKTPLLDAAAEVELSKTIEAGLYAGQLLAEGRVGRKKGGAPLSATEEELTWLAEEGDRATTRFINSNLRLVVSIARKYGRAEMPMLDLVQEGNTGLIRAVEKFDYTKGYKFSTYATWWIRQAITRGIAQQARVVRLPVHVVEELNQVGGARRTLERQLGRDPEPEEIAAELDMEVGRVTDLIDWGREHVSLDMPINEEGDTTLGDLMGEELGPGPEEIILDGDASERLEQLVGQLDDRAADIIRHRYGMVDGRQHKLADIGARHGISAERVRQLERKALQEMKRLGSPEDYSMPEQPSDAAAEDLTPPKITNNSPVRTAQKRKFITANEHRALKILSARGYVIGESKVLNSQQANLLNLYLNHQSIQAAADISGVGYSIARARIRKAFPIIRPVLDDIIRAEKLDQPAASR